MTIRGGLIYKPSHDVCLFDLPLDPLNVRLCTSLDSRRSTSGPALASGLARDAEVRLLIP